MGFLLKCLLIALVSDSRQLRAVLQPSNVVLPGYVHTERDLMATNPIHAVTWDVMLTVLFLQWLVHTLQPGV